MFFKVVSTIEKGKAVLTSVPSGWEKDGILYWPPKGHEKLRRNKNSTPESNWLRFNCIVKRLNIATFNEAEHEIRIMCNTSETDTDNDGNYSRQVLKVSNCKERSFDDIVQECVSNSKIPSIENEMSEATNLQNAVVFIQQTQAEECSNMNLEDHITINAEEQLDIFNILLTKIDAINENVKTLQETQKTFLENQQAVMLSLSKLGVQFEQVVKCSRPANTKEAIQSIQPISSLEDLIKIEKSLDDPDVVQELKKRFSVICGKGKGRGINNAYLLIDTMFDRSFLEQCSWAGGSRTSNEKICFRSHTALINFFFNLIHESDNLFTLVECHNFFKNILKNSRQRSASKKMRTSTTKNRPKLKKNRTVNFEGQENIENSEKENSETRANQVQLAVETSSHLNYEQPVYLTDATSSYINCDQISLPTVKIVPQVNHSMHLETSV